MFFRWSAASSFRASSSLPRGILGAPMAYPRTSSASLKPGGERQGVHHGAGKGNHAFLQEQRPVTVSLFPGRVNGGHVFGEYGACRGEAAGTAHVQRGEERLFPSCKKTHGAARSFAFLHEVEEVDQWSRLNP